MMKVIDCGRPPVKKIIAECRAIEAGANKNIETAEEVFTETVAETVAKTKSVVDIDIDVSNMMGDWINVNSDGDYISALRVTKSGSGLKLSVFPCRCRDDLPTAQTSPVLVATPFASPGNARAAGFFCRYCDAESWISIAANEKQNILVLQCYRQFQDSRRQPLLTREFYHRGRVGGSRDDNLISTPQAGEEAVALYAPKVSRLAGRWRNTLENTSWMRSFLIEDNSLLIDNKEGWSIKFSLRASPECWEEQPLELFAFDGDELGFSFSTQRGDVHSAFFAYSNKGLLVICGFHTDTQANGIGRIMSREFYCKSDSPAIF